MCNMLVKPNNNEDFSFIVYNIAFSQPGGHFTIDSISSKLKDLGINTEKQQINQILEYWLELGIIFDNFKEYVVNFSSNYR